MMDMIGSLKLEYGKVSLIYKILDDEGYGYERYDRDELNRLHTRQLLKILRNTYAWEYDSWGSKLQIAIEQYRNDIKKVLSTREHIPNKIESKLIRKQKIKRGV